VREQAGEYHTEIITALSKFDTTRPLNQIRIQSLTTVAMEEEKKAHCETASARHELVEL
jgi:hypothetical protein